MGDNTTMKAVMTRFLRSPAVYDIPIPVPRSDEILIKVAYVSLNPTDYKHADTALPPSKIVGCEFSGYVIDPNKSSAFIKGDRVSGVIHGTKDSRAGGFAEYVVADPAMCFLVPENVELKDACTISVGWISSLQALEQRLFKDEAKAEKGEKVSGSGDKSDALLIYSAATNCGMHALQMARLYHPSTYIIAMASPTHHSRLLSLGADICFDYNSPTLKSDILALNKTILKAFDCHSSGLSTINCASLMGKPATPSSPHTPAGLVIRTLPPRIMKGTLPQGVEVDWILAYTAMGKPFWFFFTKWEANDEDHRLASQSLKGLTGLLEQGKLETVRTRVVEGGLEKGILEGFRQMKEGKVRGEKLVVKVGGDEEV